MQPVKTKLTRLLNIRTPIVSAPMAIPGVADIAAAVSGAGGFGMIGSAFDSSEVLKEKLDKIRTALNTPPNAPIPVGIGFLGWLLDKPTEDPVIATVLAQHPAAIWFACGNDIGKYIAQVRELEANREHKTLVFTIVNSVADALRAANEWKVDALVVQGIESGGHGGSEAPPLFDLLQAVLDVIHEGPLILAAGGIATGAQIASLLTMGADGVVLGTRFLFTPECGWSDDKKEVLVEAELGSTARGMAFDEVNRTMGWPDKCDGRAIANGIMQDCVQGLDLNERLKRFDESASKGEKDRLVVWAGVGSGLTKEIKPAAHVVNDLHNETVVALKKAAALLE